MQQDFRQHKRLNQIVWKSSSFNEDIYFMKIIGNDKDDNSFGEINKKYFQIKK